MKSELPTSGADVEGRDVSLPKTERGIHVVLLRGS